MPPLQTIVETCIYCDDLDGLEHFYNTVLGVPTFGKEPGRHVFFRVGSGSMLLLFQREATLKDGIFPPHGTIGAGHFAFGIPAEAREAWRAHLAANGIPIERELTWPKGSQSIYFRDPAGNVVELLTPGLWGLENGF